MQNSENTVKYILELVLADISVLEAQRADIADRFIFSGNAQAERDINHGQLLALNKMRGRLEAMAHVQLVFGDDVDFMEAK